MIEEIPKSIIGRGLLNLKKREIVKNRPFTVNPKEQRFKAEVSRIDSQDGRRYRVPNGKEYPSITTILSSYGDKTSLNEWSISIGFDEAEKARQDGLRRGTYLHELMEFYVDCEENSIIEFNTKREHELFLAAKKAIDTSVNHVMDQECFLYSETLEIAGAVDLPAVWKNHNAIVDFKTSSNIKFHDEIESYWLQTTGYSIMYKERTGITCDKLVIIMANLDDPVPVIHESDVKPEFIDKLMEAREMYRVQKGF
jgi:hypothetical protein